MPSTDHFEIVKNLVTLDSDKKFHKELNLVSWNGRSPTYDLRGWNHDRTEMTKGITLTWGELMQLTEAFKNMGENWT